VVWAVLRDWQCCYVLIAVIGGRPCTQIRNSPLRRFPKRPWPTRSDRIEVAGAYLCNRFLPTHTDFVCDLWIAYSGRNFPHRLLDHASCKFSGLWAAGSGAWTHQTILDLPTSTEFAEAWSNSHVGKSSAREVCYQSRKTKSVCVGRNLLQRYAQPLRSVATCRPKVVLETSEGESSTNLGYHGLPPMTAINNNSKTPSHAGQHTTYLYESIIPLQVLHFGHLRKNRGEGEYRLVQTGDPDSLDREDPDIVMNGGVSRKWTRVGGICRLGAGIYWVGKHRLRGG